MESELGRVVDALPGFVWTALPDGQIDFLNRRWSEYTGLEPDRSCGRGWQEAVHPEDLPRLLADLRPPQGSGASIETEVRLRGSDGRYRWFLFRAQPSADASGQAVKWCGLSTDIESRKQAREAARAGERRAEALLAGEKQLLEMVACGHPLTEVLAALCRLVEGTASGCYCSIILLDPTGAKLQEAIAPSLPAEFNDAVRGWPLHRVGGPCQVAARDKTQVIMSDVATDTRWRNGWRALAQKHALVSCWSTPIVSLAGKVLGTFALYQRAAGTPDPHQLELIKQFTHIASIAIDGAQRDAALRQSEARLAQAERELQLTVDTIPTLVATYGPDGSRIFVNRTWRDYTGLSLEGAMTVERTSIVHPDDAARVREEWQTSLAAGEELKTEARLRRADGAYRWHAIRRALARDETGAIVKWYNVAIDIEELKRAAEALRDSELNARLAVDSIPGLVAVFTPDGEFEFVNRQVVEYVGKTLDELKLTREAIHPEDLPRATELFKQSMASGDPFEFEVRCRRFDGVYRWFQSRGYPLRDANGRIVRWYNLLIDIDERKRAEDALRQSELNFRSVIDGIPGFVAILTSNGEVEAVNRQILDYCGSSLEELRNWGTNGTVHEADLPHVAEIFTKSIASGIPYEIEQRVRRFDGVYRWFNNCGVPVRDDAGQIVRWYVLLIDIDERKRAEDALRQSEARASQAERELQLTLDTIPVMVWRGGANGYVQHLNKRWFEYTGTTPEQMRGRRWKTCVHPEDLERHVAIGTQYVAEGVPIDSEARLRRFDGEYRRFLFRPAPLRDETGTIVGWYGAIIDIEDRKRAEEKAAEAERELQRTIDNIPVLVGTYSADGARLFVNKRALQVTGLTAEDAAGEGWMKKAFHPDEIETIEKQWRECLASGEPLERETRTRAADGTYRWHLTRRVPLRDETGTIIRWYGVSHDIDDEKRAKEELRRSEAYLAEAQRLSHTGSWAVDYANRKPIHSSDEHHRLFGFDPVDGMPPWRDWMDRIHPDDRITTREIIQRSSREKTDLEMEYRICHPDGTVRYVHDVGHPVLNAAGDVVEFVGTSVDVTERRLAEEDQKRAQEELRRSEAYLAEAQRLAHTGSWAVDVANRTPIHSSDEHHRLFGFDPADGMPDWRAWRERLHPDDRATARDILQRATREKTDFEMDYRVLVPGGGMKYLHVVGHPVLDAAGEVAEFVGTSVDVTQRRLAEEDQKRVQEELRRSEAFLAKGQEASLTGTFSWQSATGEFTWSEQLYRIYEFEPGVPVSFELIATRYHPEDRNIIESVVERARSGINDFDYEHRLLMPDGSIKYIHVVAHGSHAQDGNGLEYFGAVQDVTQRRLAEEALNKARSELAHVSRVMSLSTLTASIAHEVNQPLAGIITNASTCLRMLAADPPNVEGARETARRTIRDGNRAADVITRLRALFARQAAATETVDLNEAVREVLSLVFSDLLRSRIALRTEIDDEHPLLVTGDRVQLQQVILNLVRNAADAMSDVNDRPRHLLVRADEDDEGNVRLIVQDAGVGLAPQGAERLFDAFYTTKSDGMGIGLSVSRSIIESHGGRLWAEANDGPGATFAFSIPRLADGAAGDAPPAGHSRHELGRDVMRNA